TLLLIEIKVYLEKTRPAKASYNDFLHKTKASLAKQSNYESWSIRNSQLKKQFILIARELRYDAKIIEKGRGNSSGWIPPGDLKKLRRGSRAITRSMGWLKCRLFKDEKVDKGLWRKIENMQGSILIKNKRIGIKRKVDLLSVDIFDKSTTHQGNKIMSLYNNDSQRDFNDDTDFSDDEDENIQDNSEETITSVLSSSNEDKLSILENLKNRLATTYKVVSLFDRQFPYTKELYNMFPDQIRILANEWKKASEHCYRSEIVNPLLAGTFEMIERSVWEKLRMKYKRCNEMISRKTMSDQNSE
ncbi:1236_t:CDS:2, partial [Cetraspora pellucida]